jgi:dTDP-4-dehydrorhamnose reductase
MKVAIIGANGQLGSDLVKVLGEEAIPLTRQDLDVTDLESAQILNEIKPDVVINTAAYVRVDEAEIEVENAFQVNAIGALNVANVCTDINAVNVYISTDYVFDGTKGVPYTEEDFPNPINVYGLSKYVGEAFTRNYSPKFYIVRVASLFGKAGVRGKGGNIVEFMIQKARNGEEIRVVDDVFMSPTYTKDVAKILKKFLVLGRNVQITALKSSELKRLARRPLFSALTNKKIENHGLRMRNWKVALNDYLIEKGLVVNEENEI